MATSKISAEERLVRKRLAARVRQQRCRARKREAMVERQRTGRKSDNTMGHVSVTGVTALVKENQHPNHHGVPPRFMREPSPRSVYWNEANQWARAKAGPMFHDGRPGWPSPLMETRFDASTDRRPLYSRYEHGPPLPPLPPRSMVPHMVPSLRPSPHHARYYPERLPYRVEQDHTDFYRRPDPVYRQGPSWEASPIPPPPPPPSSLAPRKPVAVVLEKKPMSQEEAAVDAILSLKKTAEIIAPPPIQRIFSQEDKTSAFSRLHQQPQQQHPAPYEVRPGVSYTQMRAN